MKPSCSPHPESFLLLLNSGCTVDSPGERYNTDCWAPPQSFWFSRSWSGAWECASLNRFAGDTAAVAGLRTTLQEPPVVQSGHQDLKKLPQVIPMCGYNWDPLSEWFSFSLVQSELLVIIFWRINFINRGTQNPSLSTLSPSTFTLSLDTTDAILSFTLSWFFMCH